MDITYQQVFGVTNIGDELREGQAVNYRACAAVTSLRSLLSAHSFFVPKLGGTGPLYRPWAGNSHEYNRHHAGLAVDIMLAASDPVEVTLGKNLVQLFRDHAAVMKWRGMLYQNVTFAPHGVFDGGGHEDHIHIDWHDSNNVKWHNGITSVPLRKASGAVIRMPLVQGNKIAKSITWTSEADTDFSGNAALKAAIAALMAKHAAGTLTNIPYNAAAFTGKTASNSTLGGQLAGKWHVAIGNWKGFFYFDAGGTVAWAESDRAARHPGRWSVKNDRVEWRFNDRGDFRIFTLQLPLNTSKVNGSILPKGQGWFTMNKTGIAMV